MKILLREVIKRQVSKVFARTGVGGPQHSAPARVLRRFVPPPPEETDRQVSAATGHQLLREFEPDGSVRSTRVIPAPAPVLDDAKKLPRGYYELPAGEHPIDQPPTPIVEGPSTTRPGQWVEVETERDVVTSSGETVRVTDLGWRWDQPEIPFAGLLLDPSFYGPLPPDELESPARYPKPSRELARAELRRKVREGVGAMTAAVGVTAAATAVMMSALSGGAGQGPATAEVASGSQVDSVVAVSAPQNAEQGVTPAAAPVDNGPGSWSAMPGDEGLRYSVDFGSRGDIQVTLCQAAGGEIEPVKKAQTRLNEAKPSVAMSFVQFDQPWTALDKNGMPGTPLGNCGVAAWSPEALAAVPNANAPAVQTVGMTIGWGDGSRYIAVDVPSGAVTAVNQRTGQQAKKAPVKQNAKGGSGKHRAGPKHRLHN